MKMLKFLNRSRLNDVRGVAVIFTTHIKQTMNVEISQCSPIILMQLCHVLPFNLTAVVAGLVYFW